MSTLSAFARNTMRVTAVIPAYHEEKSVGSVVAEVRPHVSSVLVVDDGSHDQTSQVARAAGATVLRHPINRGQGAAEQTGTDYAIANGADIVVHIDADGQHDPSDIPKFVATLASGDVDVVLGSRFLGSAPNLPFLRRWVLYAGILFLRLFSGLRLTDSQNGFRAFTRAAAPAIRITQDGMAHASEILDNIAEHRLRYREIPVTIRYTAYSLSRGQSSSNALHIVWKLIIHKFLS